jgi:LysM repeat protein
MFDQDQRRELIGSARLRRGLSALAVVVATGSVFSPDAARASAAHVVAPGETLSGIAAANGLSTETLASWNGIGADTYVISGSSISVPAASEVGGGTSTAGSHVVATGESLSSVAATNGVSVADLASANGLSTTSFLAEGSTVQIPAATTAVAATSPSIALGAIYCPCGDVSLEATAASQWNAMRQASLAQYGQDIYPAGPLSAYRTFDQQGELYENFLAGVGDPANPPGSSSHEQGVSVDVATQEMRSVIDEIGWQYGWGKYEAPDEWWHVTYGG